MAVDTLSNAWLSRDIRKYQLLTLLMFTLLASNLD